MNVLFFLRFTEIKKNKSLLHKRLRLLYAKKRLVFRLVWWSILQINTDKRLRVTTKNLQKTVTPSRHDPYK